MHYKDNTSNQLQKLLDALNDKKIKYSIEVSSGRVVSLHTDDSDLIEFCINTNPDLKEL